MAARDYEDLLLCSMAAFEGLFPDEHNIFVQDLLFSLLTWHAISKLRVHTDTSLDLLLKAKRNLGVELQRFVENICNAYETRELPSERAKRERTEARRREKQRRRQQQQQDPSQQQGQASHQRPEQSDQQPNGAGAKGNRPRRAKFNLNTYKAHAPEHYLQDIRQFGSLDSFSTQIVKCFFCVFLWLLNDLFELNRGNVNIGKSKPSMRGRIRTVQPSR